MVGLLDPASTWECSEEERALSVGENTVHLTVWSNDETVSTNYSLTLTRLPNNDSSISAITSSDSSCALASVSEGVFSFDCSVASNVTELTLYVTTNDEDASVNNDGSVSLNYGTNFHYLYVYASDLSFTMYTFVIQRAALSTDSALSDLTIPECVLLSPGFAPDVLEYQCVTTTETTVVTVDSVTSHPRSEVDSVLPGTLVMGQNSASLTVTAEEGHQSIYSVTIFRSGLDQDSDPSVVILDTLTSLISLKIISDVDLSNVTAAVGLANGLVVALDEAEEDFFARFCVVGLRLSSTAGVIEADVGILPSADLSAPAVTTILSHFYTAVFNPLTTGDHDLDEDSFLMLIDTSVNVSYGSLPAALVACPDDDFITGLEECGLHIPPSNSALIGEDTLFQMIFNDDPINLGAFGGFVFLVLSCYIFSSCKSRKLCCFQPAHMKRLTDEDLDADHHDDVELTFPGEGDFLR